MTFFTPELLADEKTFHLMETRNHQSHALIEAAQGLLRQSTEIDLSNIATQILHKYPEAHTIVLLKDQRRGFENVIFCGHIDDENGNKVADSYHAKEFVEALLLDYKLAAREIVTNRVINLREYAAKEPSWYSSVTWGKDN
jgi:hypothetical protein